MKIRIELDPAYEEVEVIIRTNQMSEEINQMIQMLDQGKPKKIIGIIEQHFHILEPSDIYFFFSEGRKVFAQTNNKKLEVKSRLYELEVLLKGEGFVRFSKSTIANLHHIKSFEMSFHGSMCAHFSNGMVEYVSRRYVPYIKESFNMGGM
ncbi:LytTR family DNA-binding domain-containing protein [Microbacteriaceae bacterium 4G12]